MTQGTTPGVAPSSARACARCGTELAPGLRSCPACHTLVHGERLKALAAEAEAAQARGDGAAALEAWRAAHELLPRESRQHAVVGARIEALEQAEAERAHAKGAPARPAADAHPIRHMWGWIAAGLFFLLTKGKLLLLGLTKAGTVFSMLAFLGVYWQLYGWQFALGLVLSIYVHEMGHVAALARYGIPASAPMFIPGLGAVVRLKRGNLPPFQDARVGLAGPVWGLGAAVAAYATYLATREPIWAAIAQAGAWLNLFNMIPVWQLDGARGFRPLTALQRGGAVALCALAAYVSGEGLIWLLVLGGGWQAWQAWRVERAAGERTALADPHQALPGDPGALALFAALVFALAWLTTIDAPHAIGG